MFSVAVPLYNLVLLTMVWRAVARLRVSGNLWTWTTLSSCFGSILFAISDAILGLREFGLITDSISSSRCQLLVMLTYYAAQVAIALSVVDRTAIAVLSPQSEAKGDQRRHKTDWNKFWNKMWEKNSNLFTNINERAVLKWYDIPFCCHSFVLDFVPTVQTKRIFLIFVSIFIFV